MNKARLLASWVAVASLVTAVAPPAAQAQRGGSRSERERAAKARDAYDDGKKAYNLGDFDRAIELWKQGYEYKDDPIFLFNIAQAYRQRGDNSKALFFYRSYLREDPKARNRDDVDARIVELQKLLDAQQSAVEAPPKGPVTPVTEPVKPEPTVSEPALRPDRHPEAQPVRDEGPDHPGRGMKIGGLVTGGVGLGATAVGIVFLLKSRSIQGDLEDAAASMMPWTSALVDKEADGRSAQTIGFVAVGVGVACLVAGGTLFAMGLRKDAAARREMQARWDFVPVVAPHTAAVSVSVRF